MSSHPRTRLRSRGAGRQARPQRRQHHEPEEPIRRHPSVRTLNRNHAAYATAAFTLQRYTHHYEASARRTADAMGDLLPDEPADKP